MIQFTNHAFKGVDESLQKLADLQQRMGDSIAAMLALFESSLTEGNQQALTEAKAIDKTINADELMVDATVAGLINKYSIAGEELRYTLGSIRTASALERAADKVKNSIKWLGRVNQPLDAELKNRLLEAAGALRAMVPLALSHVVEFNPAAAEQLAEKAGKVQLVYRTVLFYSKQPEGEAPLWLVAKNLEQTSDMLMDVMKIFHLVHIGTKYEKPLEK